MSITTEARTPAQVAVDAIKAINSKMLQALQQGLTEGYQAFWENAQGATPYEIAAEFGADAMFMFLAHAGLVEHVVAICQHDSLPISVPTAIPENWSYAVNEDGTMTLTFTPPPEPEPEPEPEPTPEPTEDPEPQE